MKRNLIFLFFALAYVLGANAQTSLIAVLCHDGEIQTFTGNKALINAYNASNDGDVITLSPGQFDAVRISKPITIRGGGMYGDNVTIINGAAQIDKWTGDGTLLFEGLSFNNTVYIYSEVTNYTFLKCYIYTLRSTTSSNGGQFIHCNIYTLSPQYNSQFIGCRLRYSSAGSGLLSCVVENCYVVYPSNSMGHWGKGNQYTNCLFRFYDKNNPSVSDNNTFNGCVYIGDASSPFTSPLHGELNRKFPSDTKYLKEGTESSTFELLDELQTTWLGTDGKQVGMHGGTFPFDPTTTTPQIKKFDVSSKTSADGKLAVDIEVDIK